MTVKELKELCGTCEENAQVRIMVEISPSEWVDCDGINFNKEPNEDKGLKKELVIVVKTPLGFTYNSTTKRKSK